MAEWQDILKQYDGRLEPGADFEQRVFFKIKKKQKQKKIAFSLVAAAGIFLLLALFQIFRPAIRPALRTGIDSPTLNKEEIPLSEELFFSAADSRIRYSLEPVSFQKNLKKKNSGINQI